MEQPRIERMLNDVRITNYGKLAVLTIAAVLVVVIVALTSVTSSELTAGDRTQLPQTDSAPGSQTGNSSSYFPGQYVNQATEPSEHIPAH